jgi:microsomal dipeptidase-like Zn-dependent dipeptidase
VNTRTHRSLIRMLSVLAYALLGEYANGQTPLEPAALVDQQGRRVELREGDRRIVGENGLGVPAIAHVARGYRVTFCESAGVRARCGRLVGANDGTTPGRTPPFTAVGTVVTVEKALFGFADLHVHPAAHLAWGARGKRGVLWGTPGMAHGGSPGVAVDLRACPTLSHSTETLSPAVGLARLGLLQLRGSGHGSGGFPAFEHWPHAHDTLHQQMHVSMLRRAYEGGLRLMVASVTDTQILDIVWNPEFSLSQARFALRDDFDYKSAGEQFAFIRRFVAANSSWMAIATSPAEAKRAMHQGKLVLVLGLEMDELSTAEILKLKQDYGVGLVTPIHLVDNSFGGAAVYEPFFNAANYVINGDLFRVAHDPSLDFRFEGVPRDYTNIPVVRDIMGPIGPRLAEYASTPAGHRNRVGLRDEYGLKRLMKSGLIIDIAHMSSLAADATLDVAEEGGVPVVHSHGGLRGGRMKTERGMTEEQLRRLANLGGILGQGTGKSESATPLLSWLRSFLDSAKIAPGAVALGSDLNGMAEQIGRSEMGLAYPFAGIANVDWTGNSRPLGHFQLGARLYDISRDGVAHIGMLPDLLAVARARAGSDRWAEFDQVFHSAHDFIATWEKATLVAPSVDAQLPAANVSQLRLDIETGTDDLKCGNVMVTAIRRSGSQDFAVSLPATIASRQDPHTKTTLLLNILPGTPLQNVSKLKLQYLNVPCDPFDTGDTWNIKSLKLSYQVSAGGDTHSGLLMHKRGAPARKLARGSAWQIYTER